MARGIGELLFRHDEPCRRDARERRDARARQGAVDSRYGECAGGSVRGRRHVGDRGGGGDGARRLDGVDADDECGAVWLAVWLRHGLRVVCAGESGRLSGLWAAERWHEAADHVRDVARCADRRAVCDVPVRVAGPQDGDCARERGVYRRGDCAGCRAGVVDADCRPLHRRHRRRCGVDDRAAVDRRAGAGALARPPRDAQCRLSHDGAADRDGRRRRLRERQGRVALHGRGWRDSRDHLARQHGVAARVAALRQPARQDGARDTHVSAHLPACDGGVLPRARRKAGAGPDAVGGAAHAHDGRASAPAGDGPECARARARLRTAGAAAAMWL